MRTLFPIIPPFPPGAPDLPNQFANTLAAVEPLHWLSLTGRTSKCIPSAVRPWLCDRDSLTRQVQRACDKAFSVRLLGQDWRTVSDGEARLLGVDSHQSVIVREVQLLCGDTPWVYARSLIPRTALRGNYAELGNMGARPLGEKLFADPKIKRGPVQFTHLNRGTPAYQIALNNVIYRPRKIFGRRSLFTGALAPVMVMEFFLPDIGSFPGGL